MSITPTLKRVLPGAVSASSASDPMPPRESATFPVRQLHHHAFYCEDSEVTRHFYEDVLQLPLVMTVVLEDDIEFHKGKYCHTFFALADGSAVAFFDYPGLRKERVPQSHSAFEHHLALQVDSDEALEYYHQRLTQAGIKAEVIDHQVYKSLYFKDPNGLNVEFVTMTPLTAAFEREAKGTAHAELERWMQEQQRASRREFP